MRCGCRSRRRRLWLVADDFAVLIEDIIARFARARIEQRGNVRALYLLAFATQEAAVERQVAAGLLIFAGQWLVTITRTRANEFGIVVAYLLIMRAAVRVEACILPRAALVLTLGAQIAPIEFEVAAGVLIAPRR